MMASIDHLVLLVPGFLGFEHFGGFPYFSQGVAAALRVALDDAIGDRCSFQVEPVSTVPAGSLQSRQAKVIEEILRVLDLHRVGPEDKTCLHLVGHSTGGLDGDLLVRASPIVGAWDGRHQAIRARVRSVLEISPPMAGTGLALTPAIELLAQQPLEVVFNPALWPQTLRLGVEGFSHLKKLLGALIALGMTNALVGQFVAGGKDDLHPLLHFCLSLLFDRSLLHDLRPDVVRACLAAAGPVHTPGPAPVIRRYLTVARKAADGDPGAKLFSALHELCSEGAARDSLASDSAQRLRDATRDVPVIRSSPDPIPINAEASDGVVNTAFQVPCLDGQVDAAEVGAIVVADHLDVVGGFPMFTGEGAPANSFLKSGSDFRSPEFSKLYRMIAKDIAGVIAPREP
jgi:hypothetical protein